MPSDGLPRILSPAFLTLNPWAGTALLDLTALLATVGHPTLCTRCWSGFKMGLTCANISDFFFLTVGCSLGWMLVPAWDEPCLGYLLRMLVVVYLASYSAWRAWTGVWSFPKALQMGPSQRLSFRRGVWPMPNAKHRQTCAGCRWERECYSGAQSIVWFLCLTGNSG